MDMVINGGLNQILAESRHSFHCKISSKFLIIKSWCSVRSLMPQNITLHCLLILHHNNHTYYKVISHQLSKISRRWTAVLLVFPERTELLFPSTKISSNLSLVSPEFPPFPTLKMIGLILSAGFPTFATKL